MSATAGLIVIGNEVLSGKVVDEHTPFFVRELRDLGVELKKVSVIPDEVETIGREVAAFSGAFDFVFTTGGVGPTHDDVTMEGVARAFGVPVVRNREIELLLVSHSPGETIRAQLRMADIPEGAALLKPDSIVFPIIVVRNVYVLPGVPSTARRKFLAIRERFRGQAFSLVVLYLSKGESAIAGRLAKAAREYPDVAIGSYPRYDDVEYKVKVTVESRNADRTRAAADAIASLLDDSIIRIEGLRPGPG